MKILLRVILLTLGISVTVLSLTLIPARLQPPSMWLMFTIFNQRDRVELYLVRPDGSEQVRLTENQIVERLPRWSPNGGWLAYAVNGPREYGVYRMQIATGRQELMAQGLGYVHALEWSSDGAWLVFETINRGRRQTQQAQVMAHPDSPPQQNPSGNTQRTISPDGKWRAYYEYMVFNNLALYIEPVEGDVEPLLITRRLGGEETFSWSPEVNYPWRGGLALLSGLVLIGVGWKSGGAGGFPGAYSGYRDSY